MTSKEAIQILRVIRSEALFEQNRLFYETEDTEAPEREERTIAALTMGIIALQKEEEPRSDSRDH